MKPDPDNYRYVCEYCGHVIWWVTALKKNGSEGIYA